MIHSKPKIQVLYWAPLGHAHYIPYIIYVSPCSSKYSMKNITYHLPPYYTIRHRTESACLLESSAIRIWPSSFNPYCQEINVYTYRLTYLPPNSMWYRTNNMMIYYIHMPLHLISLVNITHPRGWSHITVVDVAAETLISGPPHSLYRDNMKTTIMCYKLEPLIPFVMQDHIRGIYNGSHNCKS